MRGCCVKAIPLALTGEMCSGHGDGSCIASRRRGRSPRVEEDARGRAFIDLLAATSTAYRLLMMYCAYCGQRATVEIPSIPSHVCLTHAIEFWTCLLAHVKNRSTEFQTPEQIRLAS